MAPELQIEAGWHDICADHWRLIFRQNVRDAMSVLKGQEAQSAMKSLRAMIPGDELNHIQPSGPAAIYTTLATAWMMILQRLGGGMSMQAVVKDAIEHAPNIFPDNKRVRAASLSTRDTAFSDARGRLKIDTLRHLLNAVSSSIVQTYSKPGERSVFIVDGTTLTTAPTDELKQAFPPATNQHGESVWPTVLMLVAHELHSGCALQPEIGAMYGDDSTSEAAMLRTLITRLDSDAILLADAGFGTFCPVWDCMHAGRSIAFRMSSQQFNSLVKTGSPMDGNGPGESYSVTWKATKKNLTTHSHIPANAELDVVAHTVPLSEVIPGCCTDKLLHVVTTPDISREETVALYLKRYDVEHDIRDVKVTLKTERIRAHSSSMFEKELLTSLVAYNLVVQFRREAAARAGVPPRRLSFTGVWNTFQSFFLKLSPASTSEEWETRYERALAVASKDLVRVRPGRSYARQAHPRRTKTTKFQKSQRKKQKPEPTATRAN